MKKYNLWWNYMLHHTNASTNKSAGIYPFVNKQLFVTLVNYLQFTD
jgi:hypothetical protein